MRRRGDIGAHKDVFGWGRYEYRYLLDVSILERQEMGSEGGKDSDKDPTS